MERGVYQCRWNYVRSEDVRMVQRKFDEEDMPVEMKNDVAAVGPKVGTCLRCLTFRVI